MKNYQKFAFTLVELIVVITILSILGTIAFVSFQGFQRDSRDSLRITDIFSVKQNFSIFKIETGKYPQPTGGVAITYSGALAWIQGTIGDSVFQNLSRINKKTTDPLTGNEYTYSLMNIGSEYSLGAVLEGKNTYSYSPVLENVYAGNNNLNAFIAGTYNAKLLRVTSGSTDYVLALPSIVASTLSSTDLLNIVQTKGLAYNGYSNLPHSYQGTATGGFDFTPGMFLIFSGSLSELSTLSGQLAFGNNLKTAYSGTFLATQRDLGEVIGMDTVNKIDFSSNIVKNYVNLNVGGLNNGVTLTLTQTSSTGVTATSGCTFGSSTFPCSLF